MSTATLAKPADTGTTTPAPADETSLREFYQAWIEAFTAKDVDRLMSFYAPDVRVFDAIPPYETRGRAAYRAIWEECLACFPDEFGLVVRDQEITRCGDVAFISTLYRITGLESHGEMARSYLRSTCCLRRLDGSWLIVHEHTSVPFDPYTQKAAFILEDFKND